MNRIYVYVALAFVVSFAGVSWAARGFPVSIGAWQMTFTNPSVDTAAKDSEKKRVTASLDTIKQDTLQAATGFALSPCDSTMKKNLVEALTAYIQAWQIRLDCPRPAGLLILCSGETVKAAVTAFSTPLDQRVRAAVEQALSQPGITRTDFPDSIRSDMLQFGGPAVWYGGSPVCQPRMRTNAMRMR